MAMIQNTPSHSYLLSPVRTYDITSTTVERAGPFVAIQERGIALTLRERMTEIVEARLPGRIILGVILFNAVLPELEARLVR